MSGPAIRDAVRLTRRWRIAWLALAVGAPATLGPVAAGCSFDYRTDAAPEPPSSPPPGGYQPPVRIQSCNGLCPDFPAAPIVTGGAPADAPGRFGGAAGTAAPPCLTEPENGTLFPNNWLRPRIKVSAPPAASLLEIKIRSAKEAHELVVYTAGDRWTMDEAIWRGLAAHVVNEAIDVSVRALLPAGPTAAASASFVIAPVNAGGKMVYWALRGFDASNPDNTELAGFAVGDEKVVTVLKVPQIQETASGVSIGCIGCHTEIGRAHV